jgi:mxaJ protein
MNRRRQGRRATALILAAGLIGASSWASARTLVVCADPNNLPFSNRARQGFENEIAELVARDMSAKIEYVWWAQRRGYARNTVNAKKCDIWAGVATGVEMLATTAPYYRSTYVFVTRADRPLSGLSLDDERLRHLSIGVQMIGDDATNTPPAHALARRGIVENVHGFMLYGDYRKADPPAAIVQAVASGAVDVALVWGPLAGYFAGKSATKLRLEPVTPSLDGGRMPMQFDIGMGVRKGAPELKSEIEAVLAREKPAIDATLRKYGVPLD